MIDYHLHLFAHGQVADERGMRPDAIARYVDAAAAAGIAEIALTEHLFRFRQATEVLGEFWSEEPDAALRDSMARYVAHHATLDLDAYVAAAGAASTPEVTVRVGLEVDYYAGRMDEVARLLAAYPLDVALGSVHWIGAWRFDDLDDTVSMRSWDERDVTAVWRDYTDALIDLVRSRTCDVLAHVDLAKVAGRLPPLAVLEQCYARIVDAALRAGVAVEVSSAGWRKPIDEAYPAPALLARLVAAGAALTTASDAHDPETVGHRFAELGAELEALGVGSLRSFVARRGVEVPTHRSRRLGVAR